ncbi:12960_t:CDS:2, partial [Ambispora gerdemannii]
EAHQPVMLEEVLDYLGSQENGIYVDGTFGSGGHSQAILEKIKNEVHLRKLNINLVNGFLFDLGLSSPQLAETTRGFSYRLNSPLDMRMSQKNDLTAAEIINNYPYEKLADIFYHYGEERKARAIARKICHWRKKEKITTTQQLVGIIAACFSQKSHKHPARKVFQALRIFINQELENLAQALESALKYLAINGRIIVISYHSLEDRIIKQTFKRYSLAGDFQIITKKPLTPNKEEIKINHQARSAKMRVMTRTVVK